MNRPQKRLKTLKEVQELKGHANSCTPDVLAIVASFLSGQDRYATFPRIRKSFRLACAKPSSHNKMVVFEESSQEVLYGVETSGAKNVQVLHLLGYSSRIRDEQVLPVPFMYTLLELKIEHGRTPFNKRRLPPLPLLQTLHIAAMEPYNISCMDQFRPPAFPNLTDLTLHNINSCFLKHSFELGDNVKRLELSMAPDEEPVSLVDVSPRGGKSLTHLQLWYHTATTDNLQYALERLWTKDDFPCLQMVGLTMRGEDRQGDLKHLNDYMPYFSPHIRFEILDDKDFTIEQLRTRFAAMEPSRDKKRMKILVHYIVTESVANSDSE